MANILTCPSTVDSSLSTQGLIFWIAFFSMIVLLFLICWAAKWRW